MEQQERHREIVQARHSGCMIGINKRRLWPEYEIGRFEVEAASGEWQSVHRGGIRDTVCHHSFEAGWVHAEAPHRCRCQGEMPLDPRCCANHRSIIGDQAACLGQVRSVHPAEQSARVGDLVVLPAIAGALDERIDDPFLAVRKPVGVWRKVSSWGDDIHTVLA